LRGLVVTDTEDYHIAIGGAVEPYRLTSCAQYPVEGISYSGITLYDDNWDQVTPGWHKVVNDTVTPLCDFDVDYTTTAVDLLHDTWPPGVTIGGPSIVHPDWSCYWTSSVSPGVSPYSYTWSGVLSGTGSSVWGTVSSSGDLRVDVEDAAEKTGYAYKWITVSESAPYHPNCAEK
jgi:hypothetical protein